MLPSGEPSTISPEREAERLRLSEDERDAASDGARAWSALTEPEEHLALERPLAMSLD
jgi:hypothetical protein